MKKIIFFLIAFCTNNLLQAQIANTRWKTRLNIDGPVNAIFDFKKDTVSLYTVSDSSIIETMSYTSDGALITVNRIDGQSDCDNTTLGKYKYKIENDMLYLNLLEDGCDDRRPVLASTKWSRWKDHAEVKVEDAILRQYVGVYQLDPEHPIIISFDNVRLYAEGPKNKLPKSPLVPISKTKFFLKIAGVELDFIRDADGKVTGLVSHEEKDYELKKVK